MPTVTPEEFERLAETAIGDLRACLNEASGFRAWLERAGYEVEVEWRDDGPILENGRPLNPPRYEVKVKKLM